MRAGTAVTICALIIGISASAKGDEISDLKQQLMILQQRIEQLEASQKNQETLMEEKIARAVENSPAFEIPETLKWVEKVKLTADFRYRYEFIDQEGAENRNRNRIRARIGILGQVTDDLQIGFRLATSEEIASGNGDPVSTNQTLDDAFSKKSIWLDLAYFKWSPSGTGFNVFGGKMEIPFYRVGGNQLIFDSDLTPEGIAVQYNRKLTDRDEFFANAGGFWVNEVNGDADTSLWGIQAGLKHTFENKTALTGGASYYCYGNLEGSGPLIGNGFQGNSNAGGFYTSDYKLAELFGEYAFTLGSKATAVYGSYVKNTAATTSEDTGWLIGAKYGKAKDPGSWELSYDYRDLEADAVLGAFSDSDFINGGTNGKGHRFGYTYQLSKNVQGALTYFLNERGNAETDYDRLQADLIFKF
jgi:hypothetical protein